MDTWQISTDNDNDAFIDLNEKGIRLAVNVGVPKVKYNALSLIGAQGDIDLTEAYGGRFYESRPCTVFFITDPDLTPPTAEAKLNLILSDYYGKRVRLKNVTKGYILIGRLTEMEIDHLQTADDCTITCASIGEPSRYDLSAGNFDGLKPVTAPLSQKNHRLLHSLDRKLDQTIYSSALVSVLGHQNRSPTGRSATAHR